MAVIVNIFKDLTIKMTSLTFWRMTKLTFSILKILFIEVSFMYSEVDKC